MSGVCSTHEGEEKSLGALRQRDPLENLGIDGRITLTSYNKVLLGTLIHFQLARIFPAFHETHKSISSFATARHLSLSWASSIQFVSLKISLILYSYPDPVLPRNSFSQAPSPNILYGSLLSPMRTHCPAHLILLGLITWIIFGEEHTSWNSSSCGLLWPPDTSSPSCPSTSLGTPFSNTVRIISALKLKDRDSHPYTSDKVTFLYNLTLYFFDSKTIRQKFLDWILVDIPWVWGS